MNRHRTGVKYLPWYKMPLRIQAANLASKQCEKLMVLFGAVDMLDRLQCVISESIFSPYICAIDNYSNKCRLDISVEGCIRPVPQGACWIRSLETMESCGPPAFLLDFYPSVFIVTLRPNHSMQDFVFIFLKRSPHVIVPDSLSALIEVWLTPQVADLEPVRCGSNSK